VVLVAVAPSSASELNVRGVLDAREGAVRAVAFSPDGKTVASWYDPSTIKIWDVATRRNSATIHAEDAGTAVSIVYSPDGGTVAVAGYCPGIIRCWDVPTGRTTITIDDHVGVTGSVAFAPDGKTFATAWEYPNSVKLRDASTGMEITWINEGSCRPVAFSPDGKTLASAGAHAEIILWDVASRKSVARLAGRGGPFDRVAGLAFAPAGKTLASSVSVTELSKGGRPKTPWVTRWVIDLWDLASRKTTFTLVGYSATFSPDRKTLASCDPDGAIDLWDLATGTKIAKAVGDTDALRSLAFSPDGKTLASGSVDGTIKLWDVKMTGRR
jgi:WD40 repeat protein